MKKNKTLIVLIPVLLIMIVLILYQYVFLGVRGELSSMRETQEVKMKILEKSIGLITRKPDLEKHLEYLKEIRKAEESKIIEGQTLSLASASLQEMVRNIVTESGGTISSERIGKPVDLEPFKMITVSLDSVIPNVEALGNILYSLETRTPFLSVKGLEVRIRNYRKPGELIIKLDVSALTNSR